MSTWPIDNPGSIPAAFLQSLAGFSLPNVYFRVPANLRRWQAGLARVRVGAGRSSALFIGDSKTMGAGAGFGPVSTYTAGAEPSSKPSLFVPLLAARAIPASRQSFIGSSGLPNQTAKMDYDTRLTGIATWGGGPATLGGVSWGGSDTTSLTFTPQGNTDGADIYFLNVEGCVGTVTIDNDPTVLATINQTGDQTVGKVSVAFPRGTHAVKVQRTQSYAYVQILGIVTKDSTVPAVDIINAGAFGTASAFHTQAGSGVFAAENCIAAFAPDLVSIQLGSNDLNTGVSVADYTANIQSIVTKAKAAGASVALEVPTFGIDGGYGDTVTREAYRQALVTIGAQSGCIVIDHAARFVSFADASARGLMRDAIHETAIGYSDEAQALASALVF